MTTDPVLLELVVEVDRDIHRTDAQYLAAARRCEKAAREAVRLVLGCKTADSALSDLPTTRSVRLVENPW